MHTAARPKNSKDDPKKKFPGSKLETGMTSIAEAGSSTTGSIFEQPGATSFSITEVSNEEKYRLIAEAAYFRSEKRSFAPGYELEDWLAAETAVRSETSGNRLVIREPTQCGQETRTSIKAGETASALTHKHWRIVWRCSSPAETARVCRT